MPDSPAAQLVPAVLDAVTSKDPGTIRRAAALAAGLALPFVNNLIASKFGVPPISDSVMMVLEGLAAGYVTQSVLNDIHARSSAAAQANAPTPVAAVNDLNKGPNP